MPTTIVGDKIFITVDVVHCKAESKYKGPYTLHVR